MLSGKTVCSTAVTAAILASVVAVMAWSARSGTCPLCAVLSPGTPGAPAATRPDDTPTRSPSGAPRAERPAPPAFKATTLEGKAIALADYRGKVVLIDFWATWCGPCVAEIPHVKRAYERFHDRGFEIIGVSLDSSKAALQRFIDRKGIGWPQVYDADAPAGEGTAALYAVRAIPFTVLVGRDGRIVAANLRGSRLETEIEQALRTALPADPSSQDADAPGARPGGGS